MHKIRDIILSQNREFEKTSEQVYIKRTEKIDNLQTKIIKVIIGPRRAGKSYFIIHELKNRKTAYLNFDDEILTGTDNYDEFIQYLFSFT